MSVDTHMEKLERSNSKELTSDDDGTKAESQLDHDPHPETKNGVPNSSSTTPENPEADREYVTGWKLFLATGLVALASFTMLLDTAIVVTAIPRITSDFHSLNDVGWYGASYLLASSSLQPLSGKIYQQFSTKYTFLIFIFIFEIGSLICGVAQNSKMLIIGRAVAGIGGSGLMNGGLTIIAACAPPEKRPALLGFLMGFAQLGILVGPLLGGVFTEYTTWRWCFYINLPIGALVGGLLFLIPIPETTSGRVALTRSFRSVFHVFDIGGFLLFAPTMIMFLLALQWGGSSYRWGSAMIIGLFSGAAVNTVLFVLWEYKKGDGAMIPTTMVRKTVVWSACICTFFFGGVMMMSSYYLAIYFQAVRGKSPTMSGVSVLPGILSAMAFAVWSGQLVSRLGYYIPFMFLAAAFQAIACGLISTFTPNTSTANWIGYQIILGIGRGCGMQMSLVALSVVLKPAQNAVGMALIIFAQQFGGSVWLAVGATAFSSSLSKALGKYAPGVDYNVIADAGATGYRDLIPASAVPGVIDAYNEAVNTVFYIAAGASVAYFVFANGTGWKSVKKPKVVEPAA